MKLIESVITEAIDAGKADYLTTADLLKLITDLAMSGRRQAVLIDKLLNIINNNSQILTKQVQINDALESRLSALEAKLRDSDHLH